MGSGAQDVDRSSGGKAARRLTPAAFLVPVIIPFLVSCATSGPAAPGAFKLTLLHTNDVHARVSEFNKYGGTCAPKDAEEKLCFGGAARRATVIRAERKAAPDLLLLDGGDQFQGTLFYNRYKGEEASHFMNLLGYDAMAVGNHEFDDGPRVLAKFMKKARFPVLSANIDASTEPALGAILRPYVVKKVGSEKIGIVGFTTEETEDLSSPGGRVRFTKIEDAARKSVKELGAAGINKIIAVSHSGFDRDLQVARAVDGIDIIVSGHTNTYLSNTDDSAEGPYPTVVESPSGDPVLLVSDFMWGKNIAKLEVEFDSSGLPVRWEGNPITLDAKVEEAPDVLAEVRKFETPLAALRSKKVGTSEVMLVGDQAACRYVECNLGNLIADAMLAAASKSKAVVAVQNGGGIRAGIPAGPVMLGQILEVLPFGNTLSTFGLKGNDLRAVIEHSVSVAHDRTSGKSGRFLQVAGLKFTWDASKEPGERVAEITVRGGDGKYAPLDPDSVYRVVTNDFTRKGGDGFSMLLEKAINPYDFGPVVADVVADYIKRKGKVAPGIEGRITRRN